MKKFLFGASALVFAGMISGAANAAPLKMSVSGFADWYVGYANQDSGLDNSLYNDVDVMGDVEVHIKGETVLENGMKAGAVVAFSGGTKAYDREATDAVKYSYAYLDTAFGRTLIGLQDAVAKQLYVGAKDVGALGINESRVFNYLVDTELTGAAAWINTADRKNMISYVTPNIGGLMAGISYVPGSELNSDDNTVGRWTTPTTPSAADIAMGDSVVAAATYKLDLSGGKTLGLSLAGSTTSWIDDPDAVTRRTNERTWEYSAGVQFNANGLFVGAGYHGIHEEGQGGDDSYLWNISAGYENNKYAASLSYMATRDDDGVAKLDSETWLLSGKYKLAAGVDAFASFAMVKEETDTTTTRDSQMVVSGVSLKF